MAIQVIPEFHLASNGVLQSKLKYYIVNTCFFKKKNPTQIKPRFYKVVNFPLSRNFFDFIWQ